MNKNTLTLFLLVAVGACICGCRSDRSVRARRIAKANAEPNNVARFDQKAASSETKSHIARNTTPAQGTSVENSMQPANSEPVDENVRLVTHEEPPEPFIGPALDAIKNPFVGQTTSNLLDTDELAYEKPTVKTARAVKLARQNFTEKHFQSLRHENSPASLERKTAPPQTNKADEAASQPATPKQWDELLHECISLLEKEQAEKQNAESSTKNATLLSLLYLVANQPENTIKPVARLNETDREFWKELLYGLIVYFNDEATLENEQKKALVLQNLRRATEVLASASDLEVHNVAFCSEVLSYGRYTEVNEPAFHAGDETLLYAEIDNFMSEQLETKGHFETALLGSYEVRDLARRKVAEHEFPLEKEICRNRRRDFFIPYRMNLPNIKPGHYTLHLTVEDTKSKRIGQSAPIALMIKP